MATVHKIPQFAAGPQWPPVDQLPLATVDQLNAIFVHAAGAR